MSDSEIHLTKFNPATLKNSFMSIGIIGPTKSGKTTKIQNILESISSDYYIILLVSESAETNKTYNKFVSPAFIFKEFSDIKIEDIIKSQSKWIKTHPKGPRRKILIVLDDIMGDIDGLKTNKDFKNLFYAGRHYDIHIILSVHYLYAIPKSIRNAISFLIVMSISAPEDAQIMFKNYWDINFSRDQASCSEFVSTATQKGHALVIDNTNKTTIDITKRCFDFWVNPEVAQRYEKKMFYAKLSTGVKIFTKCMYDQNWEDKEVVKKIVGKKGRHKKDGIKLV